MIKQSWGCNVQPGDYRLQYCVLYLKAAKKVDLKSSYHKKKLLGEVNGGKGHICYPFNNKELK